MPPVGERKMDRADLNRDFVPAWVNLPTEAKAPIQKVVVVEHRHGAVRVIEPKHLSIRSVPSCFHLILV